MSCLRRTAALALFLLLVSAAEAGNSYVIKKDSLRIHVIEFSSDENVGFEFVDGEKTKNYVNDHFSKDHHSLIINGAYFDGKFEPVGYCKINHHLLSGTTTSLSGFITVTDEGKIELHWKNRPEGKFKDIVQSGPDIIDPGGKIGIHSRTGKEAKRTVIGMTDKGSILILTTTEVYLYDLAHTLKAEIPNIERALNLDGGPSVGLIYGDIHMHNPNPVQNFLRKKTNP